MKQERKSKLPGCVKKCELQLLGFTVGIQQYGTDENDSDDRENCIITVTDFYDMFCK